MKDHVLTAGHEEVTRKQYIVRSKCLKHKILGFEITHIKKLRNTQYMHHEILLTNSYHILTKITSALYAPVLSFVTSVLFVCTQQN